MDPRRPALFRCIHRAGRRDGAKRIQIRFEAAAMRQAFDEFVQAVTGF
jgi:hypothetical protein